MIKAIKLNNCKPYNQAELDNCKKINFVFGSNGSGKSTIGYFLDGNEQLRFSSSDIDWDNETHETICVYNKDFRARNIQQTIPGVFTIGSATIGEINELEKLKKELKEKNEKNDSVNNSLQKKEQEEKTEREIRFKNDAWAQILKSNENDFKKAFDGVRNSKDNFLSELKKRIEGIPGHKGSICEKDFLIKRANALYSGNQERCNAFVIDIKTWLDKIEEIRNNSIWNTVIAGNDDIDIASLINELDNSPWVDQGRMYIRSDSMTCPFCQQDTITDSFRAKLESFFDREFKSKVDKMKILLESYKDAADHIISSFEDALCNEMAVNIGEVDIDNYTDKKLILSKMFAEHENNIEEKISEPGKKITIPDVSNYVQEIVDILTESNNKIAEYNKLIDQREIEEIKLKDDVWATAINESESLIQSYKTDISNIEKGINGLKTQLNKNKKEIDSLKEIITEKGKNITSVQPTIDEINRTLTAYGFTNFSIQPAKEQPNYYCIIRDDGSSADGTLSEGEETFLTFLYFMQWTKGSPDPEHISDKKIIVLDDPVSSLDSNILYVVSAMIKELWRNIRDGIGDVNQLFVLTHNVFFHKEASFDPRNSLGNNINFWVIRKDDGISDIYNHNNKNPISTSYELLWSELREDRNQSNISIQNTMRRIIENYFSILGKYRDDYLVENFDTMEEKMIAKSLLNWMNDGSHSIPDDLYITASSDEVPKYKEVFKKIFEKSHHLAHYNMMMGINDDKEGT